MYTFAVIGLGYVGLRVATALAKHHDKVIGFDISQNRITELQQDYDHNLDVPDSLLASVKIEFTANPVDLAKANFYFVDIDTPIDESHLPDMSSLKHACMTLGAYLKPNDIVVFESTIYPGTTQEVLIPLLEQYSNLVAGKDFFVGYSPERIVPGDLSHDLCNTPKIISAQNAKTLEAIKTVYSSFVQAPLACAKSIKVAEAAKLLENIQRDVNIALMNEFAIISKKLHMSIYDILDVAKTKWNFLPFTPGLVGGHCTPVDPYYLIYKAAEIDCELPLISTARQVNDSIVNFIVDNLKVYPRPLKRILIMGLSFKPNIADIRSSLSLILYTLLTEQNYEVMAYDPLAYTKRLSENVNLVDWSQVSSVDAIIIATAHDLFRELGLETLCSKINPGGLLIDVPGMFRQVPLTNNNIEYWSL